MDVEKLSRRDFLKKTTVLAVGLASVTLFSGLVNAGNGNHYICTNPIPKKKYLEKNPAVQNGKVMCWESVDCNGVEMVGVAPYECPDALGTDEDFKRFLECTKRDEENSANFPECWMQA